MTLRCLFGWHKWAVAGRWRVCKRCARTQTLHFYSNRTQEWVDGLR